MGRAEGQPWWEAPGEGEGLVTEEPAKETGASVVGGRRSSLGRDGRLGTRERREKS